MGWNGGLVGVLSEPLIALIFVMGFDWVLVGGWVGGDGISGGLVGGAPLHPGHPPLAALRWLAPPYAARRGRLLAGCWGLEGCGGGCWLFGWGPLRPRASPARGAALARAPLRCAKGAVVVVGLVF